ncbi:MAG: hypothetical protein HQ538_06090 [Parcubacteria group bacterium]|nr:hypothetical protein [Parcubacteria group bacterium]
MLEKFFGSKTRTILLSLFLSHPGRRFYLREIEKIIKRNITSIRREIISLEKIGFLKEKKIANLKFYRVNKKFIIFRELKRIILKTSRFKLPKKYI